MSRRRGRRRHRRARVVTFPSCPLSHVDKEDGRQRYLIVAVVTAMLLFAVTSVAAMAVTVQSNTDADEVATNLSPYRSWGDHRAENDNVAVVTITVPSRYNTDVNDTDANDPSHQSWGDSRVGTADPGGLSGQSGWERPWVQVKHGFAEGEDDTQAHRDSDSMTSTDASPKTNIISTPLPTDGMDNVKVPDQTETLRSAGWKSFRVEKDPTCDVSSHTQVPTVGPQVGDVEWDGVEVWRFTVEYNHRSTVRVRLSKIPDDSSPETNDSPAANMTQLELKPNSSLEKKLRGGIDNTGTTAMDNVRMTNTTDLKLYLDTVLTDSMKSRERKHRVIKRIKKARAIALAVVGVLIATDALPKMNTKSTTPPTDEMKNAQVPDQTETLESEGWKRFRFEQNLTCDVYSHTHQVPTVGSQVGDGEWDGYENWGFTAKDNHRSAARVRHRVSKIPDDSSPETSDSPAPNMTQLEPKPISSLDNKVRGDIDNTHTSAMDNVRINTMDLNLYLNAVLTDSMKSRKRKYRVVKRIKKARAIALVVVGMLIAGAVAHTFLAHIPK
ncbi:uncharacterized protein LOC118423356 [Branchiostoma floridae]|uniref:Uncharacterized protein LOC118423356 n=1 Tax=Branchiostoma floridae TaxID=7739 RepID=C3ZNV1_BRAFL|nr:uncharacterized protein LOC118423356 [Branchiostoma floridae]|eukprot:XP_002589822.1 hypothetical protein BRAFLDRAFT_90532 [Branchiostoma floridae]